MSNRRQTKFDMADPESKSTNCVPCSKKRIMMLSFVSFILLAVVVSVPILVTAKNDQQKPLRVGAFNIRRFGKSKICDYTVAHNIDIILQRYDIILIQEVVDVSQTSITNLLSILRRTDESWNYVASERLGRSRYKEQYLFYYKSTSVTVVNEYQIPDPDDVFEREPYAIKMKYMSVTHGKHRSVAVAGIHVKPSEALEELEALPAAIDDISKSFSKIDGVITMGDYNAACSYLGKKHQVDLPIFSDSTYRNFISSSMDTTVGKSDCAYDRITVYGSEIDIRNARVFRFDKFLKMNETEALTISDHYPVEFLLY